MQIFNSVSPKECLLGPENTGTSGIHNVPALAKGKVPHKYVERGLPAFSSLYLAIKLAKVIKISHRSRPKLH